MAGTMLYNAMRQSLEECCLPEGVAVAFSGGVDSALLARLCGGARRSSPDHKPAVTLLTVGLEGSHDLEYSSQVARTLGMPHHARVIRPEEVAGAARLVHDHIGERSLSWHENCVAFYFVSCLAQNHRIRAVATANGIDELHCGYDAYRRIYDQGEDAINTLMDEKISNEVDMMRAISEIAAWSGTEMFQPFLSRGFIEYSRTIPLSQKVRGPDDYIRKHAVRQAAAQSGLPHSICYKRKKALQYGTRIHHTMRRSGVGYCSG